MCICTLHLVQLNMYTCTVLYMHHLLVLLKSFIYFNKTFSLCKKSWMHIIQYYMYPRWIVFLRKEKLLWSRCWSFTPSYIPEGGGSRGGGGVKEGGERREGRRGEGESRRGSYTNKFFRIQLGYPPFLHFFLTLTILITIFYRYERRIANLVEQFFTPVLVVSRICNSYSNAEHFLNKVAILRWYSITKVWKFWTWRCVGLERRSWGSVPASGPPGPGSNLAPGPPRSVVWGAAEHTVILYK